MQAIPTRSGSRVIPAAPVRATLLIVAFTGLLYVVEAVDTVLDGRLQLEGIRPRSVEGLDGVLWAPVLHDDLQHLLANTLPTLILGFLVMAGGFARFLLVTAIVWVVGGLGTWLTGAPNTIHIGASVLVFGWLVFLLVRGFVNRSFAQIALAVVLFVMWGGVLLGALPGAPGVSWQGHLFGGLGGLLAAWLRVGSGRVPQARPATP